MADSLCTRGACMLVSITERQDSLSACWKLKQARKMGLEGEVFKVCQERPAVTW